MGYLYYGNSSEPISMPDRLLAHIKVVVATKLRRSESFTLSWRHLESEGGRTTIWIQPAIPLRFVFASPDPEILDQELLRELANAANSSRGLSVDLSDEGEPRAEPAALRAA
ncbi:DUF7882 family protein [Microbacterium sp. RD1]|uniref:DUF7882 family protein n=1 Tax=Microbacterium sp. RD1 TaxID=3457313 RepID=UPI003FA53416